MDPDATPLDQAAEARRALAARNAPPASFWVTQGIGGVLAAGLPIWMSLLGVEGNYLPWVLAAVALLATASAWFQRRRSGVSLPRHAMAYPSARRLHVAVLIATLLGLIAIFTLVDRGQEGTALIVLAPVALASLAGNLWMYAAMRRDIEAGRVRV
ncbi:hypothetical protein [Nocardiopsis coralliicola]